MFDLATYLEDRRRLVDRALDAALPPPDTRPALIHEAMRYSVFTHGKRLRPILCLAAAEAVVAAAAPGRDPCCGADRALAAGVAVELLHTYTLVHDDLPAMDNDDYRRGLLTAHRKFGEAYAILAGDALQALAFEVLAGVPLAARQPPAALVRELALAAGSRGVVGGQVEDILHAGGTRDGAVIAYVHQHKTADLFVAAVRLGGLAADADPGQLAALATYGLQLGLAFQIADDILDGAEGTPHAAGELTCLSLYDVPAAQRHARDAVQRAVAALAGWPAPETEPLVAIARFAVERTH